MRRVPAVSIITVSAVAVVAAAAFAGDYCSSQTGQPAAGAACHTVDVKATCGRASTAGKQDEAGEAKNLRSMCTPEEIAVCAARLGIELEECKKLCASGRTKMIEISISGMTSDDCEEAVAACLQSVTGVLCVRSISRETGIALVCCDSTKAGRDDLVKAVTDKGYRAEIVPAVVNTACKKTCPARAACTKKFKADKPE